MSSREQEEDARDAALDAARQTMTLLKNDNKKLKINFALKCFNFLILLHR